MLLSGPQSPGRTCGHCATVPSESGLTILRTSERQRPDAPISRAAHFGGVVSTSIAQSGYGPSCEPQGAYRSKPDANSKRKLAVSSSALP